MSDTIPSAVSDALNSLTMACRAWPQPAFEKLPQGLPKLPPNDTMNAMTACNGLLHPHHDDTLILVMMGLSVIGLVALAWWGVGLAVAMVNLITRKRHVWIDG
ncbi:hypothetical protein [Acetobacter persici]|uniref:hypothetical protein n=1 Tax=Acetobacter persici TaxID=1076596 RepID=UPI001BA65799|nr:hypothetical protein [Acetobacter persici]MBS1017001.1 hypothetical protein [Acetobacter persici]